MVDVLYTFVSKACRGRGTHTHSDLECMGSGPLPEAGNPVCVCVCVCVCTSGLAHCIFQRSPYEVCVYVFLGLEHAAIV